jgi:hypothetical protein
MPSFSTSTEPPSSRGPLDFAAVRQHVPLPSFLKSLGIELQQEGNTCRCTCPLHNERHGRSLVIYSDGRWFCHGKCAATYPKGGDIIDLAGALWDITGRRVVVGRLLGGGAPTVTSTHAARQAVSRPSEPKWPARNLTEIDAMVRSGIGLVDLWERSPVRFNDNSSHAEEIIDSIFPGNPLLCIGETAYKFATKPREEWRGELSNCPLIVPNPMLRTEGATKAGRLSQHTLDATAARIYLVIECDFRRHDNSGEPTVFLSLIDGWERDGIEVTDVGAAILWHLKDRLPLVLAVHSGGKSVHGWFAAFDREEDELWPFMRQAYSIGADRVTWVRSQFVRLPDGRRQNGARQVTHYFDPSEAVTL